MPLSDEVRSLLLKYIAGETNEEESKKVEEWLSNDTQIFAEFEQLWDLWYTVGTATNVFRFNVDNGWKSILDKSRKEGGNGGGRGRMLNMLIWSSAVAAVLFLFIFFVRQRADRQAVTPVQEQAQTMAAFSAPGNRDTVSGAAGNFLLSTTGGQRKKTALPDGSVAWLNGNTRIRFASYHHSRILYLKGEAFFDVKHDAARPFIVKTDHASIQVLGTRFDVNAYPGDAVTDATLVSGSILFKTEMKDQAVVKHLNPGERVSINYLSNNLKICQVDTALYVSWKEGKLLFQGQKFEEIAKAMEHKYGVRFKFSDADLAQKRLNGYLDKESLTEALQALRLTLQFRYKIDGNTVVIFQ